MLKQAARSGKNFRSNYGKTSKTEDSCQKIMAKDARLVIYIATLTNPDKTYGWSPEKSPSIAIFSIFLCKKKRFYRIVLRDTLGQPVRFCPKNRKFQTSSPKNLSKTEKVLEENLFLQIVFPVVLKTGLEILTKALAEKPEHSIEKKIRLLFWTSRLQFGPILLIFRWKRCFHNFPKNCEKIPELLK